MFPIDGLPRILNFVSKRFPLAICTFSTALGSVVLFTLGLPALRDGRTAIGLAVTVCAILGVAFGAAGVIALTRQGGRRR